jgi:cytochrome c oxidase subunit II
LPSAVEQSILVPAGRDAERIADLFWWMATGAALIWIAVVGLTVYIIRLKSETYNENAGHALILGGGVVVPTLVLGGLLAYALPLIPRVLALPEPGGLAIAVSGEQWWWRIRYLLPNGDSVELANEIRLPVGERVEVRLESPDVIHAFWVPSLAGKMDLIPGRTTRIALEPTRTGVFRGACAEYCGASHAFMNFYVIVTERTAFDDWLRRQQQPAARPADSLAARGQAAFLANGCGACHAVRGTAADGVTAPDLTHVGSRLSVAAGTLPNDSAGFFRWIFRAHRFKPETLMPSFTMLHPDEVMALAAYMDALQ